MNEVESLLHELSKIDFQEIERILKQKLAPVWSPPLNEPILKEEDIYYLYCLKPGSKVLRPFGGTYYRFTPYLKRIFEFLSQELGDHMFEKLDEEFGIYGVNSFGEICIIFYLYQIPPPFWYELFETISLDFVPLKHKLRRYGFVKYVYKPLEDRIKLFNKLYDALGELLKILPGSQDKEIQFNAEMSKGILALAEQVWEFTPEESKTIKKEAYDAAIEIMLEYIKQHHPFDFRKTAEMILTYIREEIASAIYDKKRFLIDAGKWKRKGEQIIEEIKNERVPRTKFRLYAPFIRAFAEKIANFIKKELDEFLFCQTQFCKNFTHYKKSIYYFNKTQTARLLLDILRAMGETFTIKYSEPVPLISTCEEWVNRGKKLKEKLVKNFCETLDTELEFYKDGL